MFRRLRELISPLRQPETRALFLAQVVSGLGDWAGRLALAVLVFDRSQSAWWAAAVTVVSLLPWVGPGQVLATFADRFGRVKVMVAADIARSALFALMLIPQPVWSLLVLAFAAGLAVPPFVGARSSAMVEVIESELYPPALALGGVLSQIEVLAGYAAGGLLIAATGAETALAINAATFLASALLLRSLAGTKASEPNRDTAIGWAGVVAGSRIWRTEPLCRRSLLLFVGVTMFMILPEALVVPYAADLELAEEWVGAFAALVAVGSMIGMIAAPSSRDHVVLLRRAAVRAAVLSLAAGALFSIGTVPAIAAAAFIVSGAVDAIAVPTNQVVGERLPVEGRSAAMAVAGGVHYSAQVVTVSLAGVLATVSTARVPLTIGMFVAAAVCVWAVVRPTGIDRADRSIDLAATS